MGKINYQKALEAVIEKEDRSGRVPALLLHACCAPCSSYVLEYLAEHFSITLLYYNPNIWPSSEFDTRIAEVRRLVSLQAPAHPVTVMEDRADPSVYYEAVRGLEQLGERSERCFACYRLRLEESARIAAEGHFDYFATTLTISPLKDAEKLNEIGQELAEKYGVSWLPNDFKKRGGYLRSTQLSSQYGLYRQDYCGCVFSYRERHPENMDSGLSGNP